MAEQAGAPPVRAYTFCDKHGDLTASVATIAAQTEAQTAILKDFRDETRRTIQDTLDRIDKHCVMEGHPLMVARLAGYDRVQKEQIEVLQGMQARLEDLSLSELARKMGIPSGHLHFHVKVLKEAGLISPVNGRRLYSITHKGRTALGLAESMANSLARAPG